MHVDETDDPYWCSLELLAEKTIETGYQGRVTAGHCARWPPGTTLWRNASSRRCTGRASASARTPPSTCCCRAEATASSARRGIARVRELLDAGVNVTCGQDDMMNMFYPFGRMDMLEVAGFVAHAAHLSSRTTCKRRLRHAPL